MLKKYSVFFLFSVFSVIGYGQTKEIDSLKVVLNSSKVDLDRASAYKRLGWLAIRNDLASAEKYVDSANSIYTDIGDENRALELNYEYAAINRYKGAFDKALQNINLYLNHIKKEGPNTDKIAKGLYEKGVIYQIQGNYDKSLVQLYKALKVDEKIGNNSEVGKTLNSIGIIHRKLKQYNLAEECFLKAITIHENEKNEDDLANALSSLGSNYGEQGEDQKAISYFERCLELDVKAGNQWAIASDYQNIGIGYINLNQYNNGIEYLEKALKIQQENGFKSDMAFVMMALGSAFIKNGNKAKAEKILLNSLDLDVAAAQTKKDVYKSLAELYKQERDFEKSIGYLELYAQQKDSIFQEEGLKNMNSLQVQYQSEKKDKEIAEQKLALTESNSKTRTMSILIVSLLLGSILLWFSFRQRQKRMQQQLVTIEREQEVRALETLMEGEEKERLRIAKELHDGVNGDLAAIKFKLSSLLETNNKVINEAVAMLDNSSEQVRAISHNLVPPSLRDFNLLEAVGTYCENMNAIHDPDISFQHLGNQIVLEKKQEANLFRIVQELVTNSIKHAAAKEIHVQLSNVEDHLQLTVEDDGKGFDTSSIAGNGIGMQNVKSRVAYLGGVLDMKSDAKGSSFTITITEKSEKA